MIQRPRTRHISTPKDAFMKGTRYEPLFVRSAGDSQPVGGEMIRSFLGGIAFATLFFAAISFTSDAEDKTTDQQAEEYRAYVDGLREGAKQAALHAQTKRCDAKAFLTEGMKP